MKTFVYQIEGGIAPEDSSQKPYEQFIVDYESIRTIGKGAFGVVQLVKRRQDEQLFAAKHFKV